jgi:hypothetical protein
MTKKFFKIASLKIALEFDSRCCEILFDKALEAFASDPFETPDMRFRVDTISLPPLINTYQQIFTSHPEGKWILFEDNFKKSYLIVLQHHTSKVPDQIIQANRTFSHFIIYKNPDKQNPVPTLNYPLHELAVQGYININKIGIFLHSACISFRDKGYLFAGPSGAGKSTISDIFSEVIHAAVLTDERVLIREVNKNLFAFGTPWHGTSGIYKNKGVPLEKIFFIQHGTKNNTKSISTPEAFKKLIMGCFPFNWHKEGIQFNLEFCSQISITKQCYGLEFVPDSSIVDYMIPFLDGETA